MGKVYVLRKDAGTNPNTVYASGGGGGGGGGNFLYNLPKKITPREAAIAEMKNMVGVKDRTQRERIGTRSEKFANRLGRAGTIAGAGLGALSAFYNASSSGEPLDFSSMSNLGQAGYTGGRIAQPYATTIGAKIGVMGQEKKEREKQEGIADYSGNSQTNRDGTNNNFNISPSFDPNQFNITSPKGAPPPGPDVNNPITSNLAEPQGNITQGNPTKLEDFSNNNQYNMNDLRGY